MTDFVNSFANDLHAASPPMKLSVTVAPCFTVQGGESGEFIDLAALSSGSVDYVMDMAYTNSMGSPSQQGTFEWHVQSCMLQYVSSNKAVMIVETSQGKNNPIAGP